MWASFVLAPAGGDGAGSGGATPPRLVVVFVFVPFGRKSFDLARDVFVRLATASPLARPETAGRAPVAAAHACVTTCIPACLRLRTLIDATRFTTSAGVVVVAGASAASGVDSRLIPPESGDGGAEDGDGAQIGGGGGGWARRGGGEKSVARELGVLFGSRSVRPLDPYKYRPSWDFGLGPKTFFRFCLVYGY